MIRSLRVVTLNIHKGLSQFNRRMVIHELREGLRELDADLVFLQEVQGVNNRLALRFEGWPGAPQHEFLAEERWQHAYGRNRVYEHGHHGNALLSRFPILSAENHDVSDLRYERRGLLHTVVTVPGWRRNLHCICVHLSLHERGRRRQLDAIAARLEDLAQTDAPIIIAGDFNDWRQRATRVLEHSLGMTEVSYASGGRHARTFPSLLPMLKLDRIYVRGFDVVSSRVHRGPPWSLLSDHLAVSAEITRQGGGSVPDYVAGNRLTLLRNGGEYFPSLVAAIDGAAHEVFLESYIFADDRTGRAVADAMARAASRGVAAHVLLDAFGCKGFAAQLHEPLKAAQVEVLFFRPQVSPWPPWKQRTRLRRMHRKLACIDNAVAFVGGINIIDDHEMPAHSAPRFDYAVKIEGPMVAQVRFEAEKLWSQVSWATRGRRESVPRAPRDAPKALREGQRAALVVRDNRHHRRDIELAYLERIEAAREDIIIACAYFSPGRRFRQALSRAARRGVRVTLLMQGRIEYLLAYYASLALYGPMLGAGVRIYEYHRSFLHAKAAVFDNDAACVGSSNIDPFSLLLAREANVFVEDRRFATELRQSLEQEMREGARRVPRSSWKKMPALKRLAMWLSYRGARWLMGFYGYDRQR